MLATPYLEFWSELTDKEASMISGGEIIQKITVNSEINGCSQSGTLHVVNGKIIEDSIEVKCVDTANIPNLPKLEIPDIPNLPKLENFVSDLNLDDSPIL